MTGHEHASELGAFLQARRQEVSPAMAGLEPGCGRRRVRGLRREEVAYLASISADFYTRIEQGRRPASVSVLDAIARVLNLTEDEREYVFNLAGKQNRGPRRPATVRVRRSLQCLLAELTTTPAMVIGPRMEVLAWNRLAAALITDFSALPAARRNYVWLLFSDPAMRTLYPSWEQTAEVCVGHLRREAGRNPHDSQLTQLVGELSIKDDTFRRIWGAHRVTTRAMGRKVMRHPVVGDLTVEWDTLASVQDPDQELVVWTAEPGSSSEDALKMLAAWTATHDAPQPACLAQG